VSSSSKQLYQMYMYFNNYL